MASPRTGKALLAAESPYALLGDLSMSIIETERLILRPWREEDAAELYRWASDPEVGPAAGWAPHESVEDSLNVLRTILIKPDTWAVTQKGSDAPVGSVGIFPSSCSLAEKQPEIGYWLARLLWGKGYIPEAVRALKIGRAHV